MWGKPESRLQALCCTLVLLISYHWSAFQGQTFLALALPSVSGFDQTEHWQLPHYLHHQVPFLSFLYYGGFTAEGVSVPRLSANICWVAYLLSALLHPSALSHCLFYLAKFYTALRSPVRFYCPSTMILVISIHPNLYQLSGLCE